MRKLWYIGLALATLGTIAWLVGLFNVWWISADQSTQVALRRSCFTLRRCQPGDWNAFEPGLHCDRFKLALTPHAILPKYESNGRVWVPAQPQPSVTSGPIGAKSIVGVHFLLPLHVLVLLGAVLMAIAWTSRRLEHRRRRGRCERCGYDLRSSPVRCPECSHPRSDATSGGVALR
jgi:hypothetical protein